MATNDAPIPSGLTAQAAAERLLSEGGNELPSTKPRNIAAIAWKVVSEPMLLLLIACGGIYLLLGDKHEAMVLLGFVFVIIGITLFQEHKTERALEALRDLSSPRALVIRDGVQTRIAGREVVRGDIIMLSEGDRVPADAVLLSCMNMTVDESLLTGESVPVSKAIANPVPDTMGQAGGDALPFVFSGSLVVQGKGSAQVLSIGTETAIGQIGKALFAVEEQPTRMQKETAHVVKIVAIAAVALAVFLAIWYGATRGEWLNGLLVGITFAMAVIPEEMPIVLTLFLGLGAWRISRQRVLTRRIPAIETLGSATVLCVDKTGTLTQNRMAVAQLFSAGKQLACDETTRALPEDFHEVLEYAILASHRDPFDPMEVAIQEAGVAMLGQTEHLHDSWGLVNEYPLSKELLAMSRVWESQDREHYVIASKGAPEAIADLCHLSDQQIIALTAQVNLMAGQGLRVLGVAKAIFLAHTARPQNSTTATDQLPEIQHDFDFELLGLIGLADPVRPGVTAAIKECQSAGIRVIMITGDYPATALSIATQCGLFSAGGVMSGADLHSLSDAQLQGRIRDVNIFCRVVPEQKLRLVNVLKNAGEIVAMTGDGVNDAPALKAAHIGVAMGKRGTDVARESAALVLLDDDFSAIVAAVKLGRRIFDNLRKTISFIIAAHVPVIGMSLIPVMMGWPVVLMPVHILVLQLIIDPTCSLVFEAETEEPDVMQRAPRATDASIFERPILLSGALQGLALLATVLAIFWLARQAGIADEPARALAFTSMVVGNIGLIFINRSLSRNLLEAISLPNPALWLVCGSALLILAASLLVPTLSGLFYFGHPAAMPVALSALASAACIALLALVKSRGYLPAS
ncbi:MAG: cation-translocating P-type ATPase [Undibacterium sp.]|nr:cation-translocating P-type ATPase [Undibacterium sp.]